MWLRMRRRVLLLMPCWAQLPSWMMQWWHLLHLWGSIQGAFRFILAKVSYYVVAAQNSAFMLDVVQSVSAESSSCQHITAKMHHPKTEAQFFEMLNLWSLVVHSVGLANTVVVQLFIHEVVFRTTHGRVHLDACLRTVPGVPWQH